jgi:hypothetical protein
MQKPMPFLHFYRPFFSIAARPCAGTYKKWCNENGVKYFSVASGGGTDNNP